MCNIPHHFISKLTIPLLVLLVIFLFGIGCFVRKRTIMSKKLIYLISFALVLCLFQTSIANAADPSLVGWWKFDDGSGTIAYDSSGNGNDGTFNGDPQWVPNQFGYALGFDGSGDWLDCGEDPSLQITDAVTVSAWIKVGTQGVDHKIGGNQDGANGGYKMTVYNNNRVEFEIRTSEDSAVLNRNVSGGIEIEVDVWYHVTGVYSLEDGYIRTYVNGVLDREMSTTEALGASPGSFKIGCEPFTTSSYNFNGVMDDIRIYNHALTEGEILGVMEDGERPYAFNPKPADGTLHDDTWVNLRWSPGGTVVSHDVYFGDNFDEVDVGTGGTFQGIQTATSFRVGSARSPYHLVPGTTYYWRIDEVEADGTTIHKGDIWSFTISPKTAYGPDPPNGAIYVDPSTELSWEAGFGAMLHTVYFGDDFDVVNNAAGGLPQATTTYTPGPLELDKVYYWRVDEVEANGTIHRGDVWSFSILPEISITDPSLIGWWRFDDGSGTTAIDSSGNGFNIPLHNTTWEDGIFGGALQFHRAGYGYVENFKYSDNAITVCAWVRHDAFRIGKVERYVTVAPEVAVIRKEVNGSLHFYIKTDGNLRHLWVSDVLTEDLWHHVAGTWDGATQRLYIDGLEIASQVPGGVLGNTSSVEMSSGGEPFNGMLDEVRIYNRALTQNEIQVIMQGEEFPYAFSPTPPDGSVLTDTNVTLSWSLGRYAVSHDIYFGENFDDVNDGAEGTFRGNQAETFFIAGFPGFPYPDGLVPGTTYYWRIDEVNDTEPNSPWKGNVWSFLIAPDATYALGHFTITYYDNYNYDTGQWDAWQSEATPKDAWDDKYLADGSSGNTVYTDHAFMSITTFDLRGGLFSKDGHASGGEDWNPLQSIGDNVSGQSAHHVFAALFKGLIYLEEGDNLMVASDDDVYVFLDGNTVWGQEVLSVPSVSFFDTDSLTVTAAQEGFHTITVKYIERLNDHSGIEITLNGGHLQNSEVFIDIKPGSYPLSEALDTALSFTTGGDADWFSQTTTSYYDGDAAQSGDISHNQESWIQTTVSGAGTVEFYWKVSSEEDEDFLEFYVDGSRQEEICGLEGWEQEECTISTSGSHVLEWRYVKDGSGDSGSDCGWVDKVEFVIN
ncbi:MAG: LamG domain-containing protein [Planctomycetes bacterium]|nr:LamG domain-containing protein [Planctomycetota bacterium]